jgi:RNA polymerase sigma-54 factor
VTIERPVREDDGDGDADGMSGVDNAPTRDDLPDVTDFADYGGGTTDGDWGSGNSSEDEDFAPQQVAASSLRQHLMGQLALLNLPLRDRQIVEALIDALDDDGYLKSSLEEIAEMFSEHDALEPEELMIGSSICRAWSRPAWGRAIRRMPGAAAAALPADTPYRTEALKIVDGHLPLLARAFETAPRAALRRSVRRRCAS